MNTDSRRDGRGLSTSHLMLVFLAGVAVCGVFFSLGFLVGYNERSVRMSPVTEQVTTSGAVPPALKSPPETVPIGANSGATAAASGPPRVANSPVSSPPSSPGESGPGASPSAAAPSPPPAKAASGPDTAATSPGTGAGEGGFIVQVTAMRAKHDAEAMVRTLRGHGYHVLLVAPGHANAKDSLYRVQVGPFASRESAEKTLAKLKHEGFKPFIRH